ncbi:MAG: sigma-70 family RNA polymerase sigma factor [Leptolyngbyaceae cyanobacterium SL_7_1]|nr:sigma-70 family RNA polymerase sigma factor [Leptolyngbyaceae cyanobacterium SL_7_1]
MAPHPPTPESTDSSQSDQDLLHDLRNGRVDALGKLYDRYSKLVYGLAFRVLGNSEEAEDITQEVFLALWRRDGYDPKRGSLNNFLMTMTRSRSIDKLRSRGAGLRALQRIQGTVRSEWTAPPLEQVSIQERSQRVREALAQLSDNERQVLEIAYYEGLSQSEIAKRLDTPLGTVKTRSRQALLKLRQTLQDYI